MFELKSDFGTIEPRSSGAKPSLDIDLKIIMQTLEQHFRFMNKAKSRKELTDFSNGIDLSPRNRCF